jgi:methylthioribulose-1-phosphate dehydratase
MTNSVSVNASRYLKEKEIICSQCKNFYNLGWVSGTGGGMSVRVSPSEALIAPSGVQKESIKPEQIFLIDFSQEFDQSGKNFAIKDSPQGMNISACTSIFVNIYKQRPKAQAVIHSHSMSAVMLTKIIKESEVTLSGYEMLKGLEGCTYFGKHTLPILNNVEHECDLAEAVEEVVKNYPQAHAVLVRDHGVYIWGDSPERAKVHAECYDYLFQAFVEESRLKALNLI